MKKKVVVRKILTRKVKEYDSGTQEKFNRI